MPEFEYEVLTKHGETQKGKVIAADKTTAVQQLQSQGFFIARIETKEGRRNSIWSTDLGQVSLLNKTLLVEQLSAMLKAGLPLVEALQIVSDQFRSAKLRDILQEAAKDVASGIPLSASFSKHPKVFDRVFIQVLRAGEVSGILEKNLRYLASELRRRYELTSQVRGALLYPIVIVCAMIGVGFALMIFVVPKIADVLKQNNTDLPWTTQTLLAVSDFMVDFWWLIILVLAAVIVFFWWLNRFPSVKEASSAFWGRWPIIHQVKEKMAMAAMSGTLGNLVKSGMPIVEAINVTGETMKDRVYGVALRRVADRVKKGVALAESLEAERKLFPPTVIGMTRVGERTGEVTVIMDRLAELYSNQVLTELKSLSSLIEPILMLVVGAGIGLLALSIITPIYSMMSGV